MIAQYVIVDNGKDYSDNSVDIYKTSLFYDEVVELFKLWTQVFGRGSTTPGDFTQEVKAIAFAHELYDGKGNLLKADSLKDEYGNFDRYDYHFDPDLRADKLDVVQIRKDIEAILAKDEYLQESK